MARFPNLPYKEFSSARPGSFPWILALWAFISLHFNLLGLDFLSFRRFGPAFPCILDYWAFISLHFGLLGLDFVAFWPFGGQLVGPPISCQKWPVFPIPRTKNLAAAGPAPFCNFWPFGPSFLWILALCALISFHFGVLGLHFLQAFWPFGGQLVGGVSISCKKWTVFPISHTKNLAAPGPALFWNFWPFGPSFPSIFALWAFISLHFGLLGLHFFAFWHFRLSFHCILALWAFISLHFGLLGVSFWGPPPASCQKRSVCLRNIQRIYQMCFHFGLVGLHFLLFWPCILAFWAFISFHFGLVGFDFLACWVFAASFWAHPTSYQKYTKNLSAPGPACPLQTTLA